MSNLTLKDFFKLPGGDNNDKLYNMYLSTSQAADPSREDAHNSCTVFDHDWIDASFMAPLESLKKEHRRTVLVQSAFFKFKSCRLGGNTAVNMPPGNCHLADPIADTGARIVGLKLKEGLESEISYGPYLRQTGLGRWYSEFIDDHTQTVILTFGLPKFNSVVSFLSCSSSFLDNYIATHGTIPSTYVIAKAVTDVVRFKVMPFISLAVWAIKVGVTAALGNKPYSYYYLEPAMNQYWTTVNDIANYFAVKLGILNFELIEDNKTVDNDAAKKITTGKAFSLNKTMRKLILALYGGKEGVDAFFSNKLDYIDVYNIVSRRAYIFNEVKRRAMADMGIKGQADDGKIPDGSKLGSKSISGSNDEEDRKILYNYLKTMVGTVSQKVDGILAEEGDTLDEESPTKVLDNIALQVQKKADEERAKEQKEAAEKKKETLAEFEAKKEHATDSNGDGYTFVDGIVDGISSVYESGKTFAKSVWDYGCVSIEKDFANLVKAFDLSARGATSAAIFAVNPTGGGSDSISNSTSSISTGDTIKGLTRAAQDARFSVGGGKTGIDSIDWILDKLIQVGAGVLESYSFGLSNFAYGIINGGYVEIPDKWDDSSFSGNSVTYTMDLVSPYGNELSRLQHLYIPLAMILAGACPRGIGKAAYLSPYLCSCFSKSVQNISLGIISDVTVTYGITNQAFVNGVKTNSLKVTFTVKDLSNNVSARVNTSSLFGSYGPVIEEDTPMAKWVNRLAGVDYEDLSFFLPRLNVGLNIFGRNFGNVYSATRIGHSLGNFLYDTPFSFVFKNPNWTGVMIGNK